MLWIKTDYPEGEYLDLSKAFTIRVIKGDGRWHIEAELRCGLRTVRSFDDEQAAKDYLLKIMELYPFALSL
jgi:hypothetical protein